MLVIYVEDDVDDFAILSEMLAEINADILCVHASNGRELFDLLNQMATLPDVVVMDLNMPIMDGKSSLKALRADPRFASIPVCIYTTGVNPREGPQCLDLGANTYTIKANSVVELRAFLEELVERYMPGVH